MADESKINLRVLTLNCWGIPYVSKMWKERKVCIAKELALGHYDLVSLQEIWNRNDFEYISQTVSDVLPYSHYFYSGVIGSGVCVFSRFPIIDTFTYRYSLNGYMYNFTHGDWFGGKAAGYCIIDHPKQPIHFFATHMHAEYSSSRRYVYHRTVQSYQFSQFIQHLTRPNDIVIACGDMNCEPSELCYGIIKDVTGLVDAWDTHGRKGGCDGNTADVSQNTFSGDGKSSGSRIDYIFYRCQSGSLECVNSLVTMGLVPGRNISFSDHEGVEASFIVTRLTGEDSADSGPKAVSDVKKCQEALWDAQDVLSKATGSLSDRNIFSILIASAMLIFVMSPVIFPVADSSPWSLCHIGGKFLYVARIITTVILSGFMFYLIFNVREEYSAYKSVQQMIDIQMKQISPRKRINGNFGL